MLDDAAIDKITRRGVVEIISRDEFVRMLQAGKPLRLKMGFDPSRPDIHLGHVVGLRKLRQLQELGHQVILIVGDWTAQIGDPSGQSATRPTLTHEEVVANADSYLRQFFKVVDRDRTQVVWQSEWFGKFTLADVIQLTGKFTVAQFLARDDFANRYKGNQPIALTELLYPLLQARDSVEIQSDVEFGGTDQRFNLLVGRELQGMMGQRPQQCFLMPLLVGTDGVRKMSKSLDNYVAVEEPPSDIYGKLMSLPDSYRYSETALSTPWLIPPGDEPPKDRFPVTDYFEWLTDVPDQEIDEMRRAIATGGVNPMDLKKRLAWEITAQFHDRQAADTAQQHFERVFQGRNIPQDIPEFRLVEENRLSRIMVIAGLADSTSEAKRLISQGAVELINDSGESQTLLEDSLLSSNKGPGDVIKVGKRRFLRLVGK